MKGFAMLWSKTLDSSIWVKESKETRLLWVTMLMMKDSDGMIQSSLVGLASRAKLSDDECRASLKILLSPDQDDTSKVEEGRRVREVPGGWQIVNHELYRFSTLAKRELWRAAKADQRERDRVSRMTPKELAAYLSEKPKGYAIATGKPIGIRKARRNGEIAGRTEGVIDACTEAHAAIQSQAEA